MAHVHAKTTLTVIFPRFDRAPIGRTAGTGRCRSRYNRKVQQTMPALPEPLVRVTLGPLDANLESEEDNMHEFAVGVLGALLCSPRRGS